MRVILFFPPHFSARQPYISLPILSGFLNNKGVVPTQYDLNISSVYYFLSQCFLSKCSELIHSNLNELTENKLNKKETKRLQNSFLANLDNYTEISQNIEESLNFLKTPYHDLNIGKLKFHKEIIGKAFSLISAAFQPTHVSLERFYMVYSAQSTKDTLQAIKDVRENPYIEYFKHALNYEIKINDSDLVGISIICFSQVIPSFTLAKIIRERYPKVKIVVGGPVFTRISEKYEKFKKLFDLIDFIIVGEGEVALYELWKAIYDGNDVTDVPNLIHKRNGRILKNSKYEFVPINSIPTPCYDNFPLDKYLSSKPVLSVQLSRGCSWKKCTFCNLSKWTGNNYSFRDPNLVFDDIKTLISKYNASFFVFVNETLDVKQLRSLADRIIKERLNIHWHTSARFSNDIDEDFISLMKKAGCEKLMFGLESGSRKILSLMKKGISLAHAEKVLLSCKKNGIGVHLYLLTNFPGETAEDIEDTIFFLKDVSGFIIPEHFSYTISEFQLLYGSPIFHKPTDFGITKIRAAEDLQYIYDFRVLNKENNKSYLRKIKNLEETLNSLKKNSFDHISEFMTDESRKINSLEEALK